jgi:hypothetical protein
MTLRVQPLQECPYVNKSSPIFLISLAATVLYPVGIPALVLLVLYWFQIPKMAKDKTDNALLRGLISICRQHQSLTVSGQIARLVGSDATGKNAATLFHAAHHGRSRVTSHDLAAALERTGMEGITAQHKVLIQPSPLTRAGGHARSVMELNRTAPCFRLL